MRAATLLAMLILTACGQAPGINLMVDDATAELLRGADVQVELTLSRTGGASGDVTLTISGVPANVDAIFSPATLSGATLSSVLTLNASAAASEGSYDLTITATGTGLSDTAALTLDVISLSVTGRVVTTSELPVTGASVASQGDTAVTDLNGTFELSGLAVPYDLSVWKTADEWVHIYAGLTSDEPLLVTLAPQSGVVVVRTSTVSGNLTGGVIPVAANQTVIVCVEGQDATPLGCDFVTTTESSYSIDVEWTGGVQHGVRLHALQLERDASGYPVAYQGYASLDLTLTDGVPTMANLDLGAALATTNVDVTLNSPVVIQGVLGAVQLSPGFVVAVAVVSSPAVTHALRMPVIEDGSYTFVGFAGITQFGWTSGVTGSAASVAVPAVPLLITPPDLAIGVTAATNFTVSNPTGGAVTHIWSANPSDLLIGLTTMDSTSTIPDLTPYGLALPPSTSFNWQAIGSSGTSTDDGTGAIDDYSRFLSLALGAASRSFTAEGTFGLSDSRDFTTAP